ncbi:MAG: hypothetical protein KF868_11070 [Acidobacteria bacterium]|nr:hypothetical protein [Acidobacteriota bacterium]MCW5969845.1 hypothetical protein [Blastocatellales bacterium]
MRIRPTDVFEAPIGSDAHRWAERMIARGLLERVSVNSYRFPDGRATGNRNALE